MVGAAILPQRQIARAQLAATISQDEKKRAAFRAGALSIKRID